MIIRSPRPESNFYLLDKRISEDRRLSWAARGLLIYLLGKPDNWRVSVAALIEEVAGTDKPTGRDGTYALIEELIKAGYVRRDQPRGKDGKLGDVTYVVFETPSPLPAQPDTAQPDTAEPLPANPTLTSIEYKTRIDSRPRIDNNKARSARMSPASIDCPPDVDPQVFSDWLEVRKAKRAGPVTQTVLARLRQEADKAGISLQEAIEYCCLSGWQGFRAEWYSRQRLRRIPQLEMFSEKVYESEDL